MVRQHEDLGDKVGKSQDVTRATVVANIKDGKTYMTIFTSPEGWKKGQDVRIITVRNEEFIRTDANAIAADNLENLPEF